MSQGGPAHEDLLSWTYKNIKTLHQSKEFTMIRFSQCEIGGTIRKAPGLRGRVWTLVAGITLVIAVVYIAINIVADLIVVFLVPRLRTGLR